MVVDDYEVGWGEIDVKVVEMIEGGLEGATPFPNSNAQRQY